MNTNYCKKTRTLHPHDAMLDSSTSPLGHVNAGYAVGLFVYDEAEPDRPAVVKVTDTGTAIELINLLQKFVDSIKDDS